MIRLVLFIPGSGELVPGSLHPVADIVVVTTETDAELLAVDCRPKEVKQLRAVSGP